MMTMVIHPAYASGPTPEPGSEIDDDLASDMPDDLGDQTALAFDGTYKIHLSESGKSTTSARPEPGYFDRLVITLFDKAGLSTRLSPPEPWKRQLEKSATDPGHVIYPTTRTKAREDHFKWVGPISRTVWNLYGFATTDWQNASFDTVLREASIGVLLGSAREAYLRKSGAQKLVMVPREELLLPMLMAHRVDMIAIGGNILRHYIKAADKLPKIESKLAYRTCYLYVAVSGDVPDRDITTLQRQLDRFKRSGFFIQNRRDHGLSTNAFKPFLRAMLDLDNNGVGCVDLNGHHGDAGH